MSRIRQLAQRVTRAARSRCRLPILRLRRHRRRVSGGPRRVRVLDWRGNRAAGDDLLGLCVRRVFDQAADELGLEIEFAEDDDADLVVIGGGTLLGPRVPAIASALTGPRIPMVVFGTGYRGPSEPLDGAERARFQKLLSRSSMIGVRGALSRERCAANGVDGVEIIGDPGLAFDPVPQVDTVEGFSVGVMVRSMGKTGEVQYLDNEGTYTMIAELVDSFIEFRGAIVRFIGLAENVHDSDREGAMSVMGRMRARAGADIEFIAGDDPVEAFSTIASMDYVISQRLHPTVIAWRAGKPCVAFDYQFNKTADFMDSIGMSDWVLRTDEYSKERYLSMYDQLEIERPRLALRASRAIDGWRSRQREFAARSLRLVL